MTQADKANEGREEKDLEKSHKGFWQHQILQLIDARTEGHDGLRLLLDDVDKILAFHKQLFIVRKYDDNEAETLRDQLSKEREMRTEFVKGLESLLEMLQPFENMEAIGPLESFKMREIESLIAKATELDKK